MNQRVDLVFDPFSQFLAGAPEVVFLLETEPEVRTVPEVTGQAERGVGRDGTTARNNSGDAAMRNTRIHGKAIPGQAHLVEEFRAEDFAGMREMKFLCFHGSTDFYYKYVNAYLMNQKRTVMKDEKVS